MSTLSSAANPGLMFSAEAGMLLQDLKDGRVPKDFTSLVKGILPESFPMSRFKSELLASESPEEAVAYAKKRLHLGKLGKGGEKAFAGGIRGLYAERINELRGAQKSSRVEVARLSKTAPAAGGRK